MNTETLVGMQSAVRGWARWPATGYQLALEKGISFWFESWILRTLNVYGILLLWMPFICGLFLWSVAFLKKLSLLRITFFLFSFSSVIFWFYLAPDIRFGDGFLWSFGALGFAFAVQSYTFYFEKWWKYCLILFLLSIGTYISFYPYKTFPSSTFSLYSLQVMPSFPIKKVTVNNRVAPFQVYIPVTGDQCGNSPLPCTPSVTDSLFMRQPGNLGMGFKR